jgi:hypothetical protein
VLVCSWRMVLAFLFWFGVVSSDSQVSSRLLCLLAIGS